MQDYLSLMALDSRRMGSLFNILAMCTAMAVFVANDTLVKLAAVHWPSHQIMFLRGLFAIVVTLTLVVLAREFWGMRLLKKPIVALRCAIEGFVAYTFITALAHMPIADITAILLLSPLLITMAAAVLFGEKVRWRRWMAVIVGFIGMLLVVRPGGSDIGWPALLALASTFGVAARDLLTRRLPAEVPSTVVAFGTTLATTLTGGFIWLLQPKVFFAEASFSGTSFAAAPLLACALAAVLVALGNLAIILAFRDVETSLVSPYRYTVIVWAVLSGYLVFGNVPTLLSWMGISLIVASGLYTLYREHAVSKMRR
jgi:drug/metabolite transporter (DMT)-like permease